MTAVKIIDASALGALLFGEPDAELVSDRLRGGSLIAPALLEYEIASICLKKLRRYPEQSPAFLDALATGGEMGIEIVTVDQLGVVPLAVQFGLTCYDASYLWLARQLNAELVTLDQQLARAATLLRPGLAPRHA